MTRSPRSNGSDDNLDAVRFHAWLTHETHRRRLVQGAGLAGAGAAVGGIRHGAAAQTPVATPGAPKQGGHLVSNLWGRSPGTIDPPNVGSESEIHTSFLVYDQLVRMGADGITVEPSLAESWETAADGLSWTFHLRESVFHDGSPVTADDVVFSLERATAGFLALWLPTATFLAPDPSTVVIELDQPWSSLEGALTQPMAGIVSRQAVEGVADPGPHPIGSGPFKVESWEPDTGIELVRHDGYWDAPRPYLDRLTLRLLADSTARLGELEAGALDLAIGIPWDQFDAAMALPGVTTDALPLAGFWFYPIPVTVPPYDDVLLRRAMNHAIDREAMGATILGGASTPATSFLAPPTVYRDASIPGFPYDPDLARELVAQSTGKDGFEAILRYDAPDVGLIGPNREIAERVAANLSAIGGSVEAVAGDGPAATVRAEAPNMWFWGWWTGSHDPIDFALVLARGDINMTTYNYYSEEAISLFYEAQNSLDPAAREHAWTRMQAVLQDDAPYLLLLHQSVICAARDSVRDFTFSPTGAMRFWEVWLDE